MLGLDSVDPRFGEGRARGGTVSSAAKVAAHQHYLPRRVPNLRRYVKGPCAGADAACGRSTLRPRFRNLRLGYCVGRLHPRAGGKQRRSQSPVTALVLWRAWPGSRRLDLQARAKRAGGELARPDGPVTGGAAAHRSAAGRHQSQNRMNKGGSDMTVYVDDMRRAAAVGGLNGRWSHLMADTSEELFAFAATIGWRWQG